MLKRYGERGHPCLIPESCVLYEEQFSPLHHPPFCGHLNKPTSEDKQGNYFGKSGVCNMYKDL